MVLLVGRVLVVGGSRGAERSRGVVVVVAGPGPGGRIIVGTGRTPAIAADVGGEVVLMLRRLTSGEIAEGHGGCLGRGGLLLRCWWIFYGSWSVDFSKTGPLQELGAEEIEMQLGRRI